MCVCGHVALQFLTVIKVGFVFTGRVGTGLVVARLPDGRWSAPSAIATAGVGWGAQIGGEITDFVVILNTKREFLQSVPAVRCDVWLTVAPYRRRRGCILLKGSSESGCRARCVRGSSGSRCSRRHGSEFGPGDRTVLLVLPLERTLCGHFSRRLDDSGTPRCQPSILRTRCPSRRATGGNGTASVGGISPLRRHSSCHEQVSRALLLRSAAVLCAVLTLCTFDSPANGLNRNSRVPESTPHPAPASANAYSNAPVKL